MQLTQPLIDLSYIYGYFSISCLTKSNTTFSEFIQQQQQQQQQQNTTKNFWMCKKPEFRFLPEKCHLCQKEALKRLMCSKYFQLNCFVLLIDMKNDDTVQEGNEKAKPTVLH